MIRVLHYIPGFGYGGIESLVVNMFNSIDKNKFTFDFLVESDIPDYYKNIIEKNGGKVIKIPKMTEIRKIFIYLKQIREVFVKGNYDVFHSHSLDTRPFPMIIAKKYGIKVRIMHIHFNDSNNKHLLFIKKAFIKIGEKNANFYIACSKRSAKSIFSKSIQRKALILNNGIDTKKYMYDSSNKNKIRKKTSNHDFVAVGCIGRLSYLKNQKFILDIIKKIPKKFKFYFLGDGDDKNKLLSFVKSNHIENAIFLGNVENVKDYLDFFDLVVIPSISEAMPLTILELQANGVPAIVSNAIDDEFIVNENILKLNLNQNQWINAFNNNTLQRVQPNDLIKKFDIKSCTKLYEDTLMNLLK